MKFKQIGKSFILRIDRGEEVVETLKIFCKDNNIKLGSVSGIGATDKITIGHFNTRTKEYHSKELAGDYEISSLNGNISTMDGEVYLHLHINLSGPDYNTYGGHLNLAVVSGTCEIVIGAIDGEG